MVQCAAFPGRLSPVFVAAPEAVMEPLSWLLNHPGRPAAGEAPNLTVRQQDDGFFLEGDFVPPEAAWAANAFGAAIGLADALTRAAALQAPEDSVMHGAALVADDRLIVLLGDSMAGKSTVAIAAAARGWQIFGDDRLGLSIADGADLGALEAVSGVASGLQPKCRLPLPETSSRALRRFVDTTAAATTDDVAYLRLGVGRLAPMASRLPIAAVFTLSRSSKNNGARAVLAVPLEPPAALRALLRHSFAPHIAPRIHLDQCAALARALPFYDLRFSQSEAVPGYLKKAKQLWLGTRPLPLPEPQAS